MRPLSRFLIAEAASAALLAGCAHHATTLPSGARWLGSWQASPQLTEPRNMPPAPGLTGSTLRQVIHVTQGGSRWRFRLSNEFGDGPLVISSVHVASSKGRDAIDAATDVALAFNGAAATTIPIGGATMSDPLDLRCPSFCELAITMHISAAPRGLTGHPGSRMTSFIATGDHVTEATLPGAVTVEHWYVLSGAQVLAEAQSAAVVVLGNSIADGRGSGTDRNDRWPDNLAKRLASDARTSTVAVLNAGIGGNTVLRGGLGPTALSRFQRDVLDQPGARLLIVSEGVNDIGGARGADSSASTARQLIAAYQTMIARAKARGLTVYGATILPFTGSQYGSPDHEKARQAVNRWIRESGAFAAVIDLDAVMRDPADPTRLRADVDSGDHLHPNEFGYRVMADAIDLGLFGRKTAGQ
jgi:lysophospholipase L1-like esterase